MISWEISSRRYVRDTLTNIRSRKKQSRSFPARKFRGWIALSAKHAVYASLQPQRKKYSKYPVRTKWSYRTRWRGNNSTRPSSPRAVYYSTRFDDVGRKPRGFSAPSLRGRAETSRHFETREGLAQPWPRYRKCGLLFYRDGHKSDERSYAISGARVRATSTLRRQTGRSGAETTLPFLFSLRWTLTLSVCLTAGVRVRPEESETCDKSKWNFEWLIDRGFLLTTPSAARYGSNKREWYFAITVYFHSRCQ